MVRSFEQGFSVLEVLFASALLVLVLVSGAAIMFQAEAYVVDNEQYRQALFVTRTELEKVLVYPTEMNNAEYSHEGFMVRRTVKPLSRLVTEVSVESSWADERGREQSVRLASIMPEYADAVGEETCNVYFSHTGQEPRITAQVALPAEATDIDVSDGYAYVTVDDSIATTPDLYVIDIGDPANPTIVGAVNTGPGAAAVHVVGDYAYVANISTVSQLQIIDVSNKSQPTLRTNYKVPNVLGESIAGQSIYVHAGRVYLGLIKVDGPEFHIISVDDISVPVVLGSFETGTKINAILVHHDVAYLTTPNQEQLRILDVSNPGFPQQIQSFSASGYQSQDGRSIELLENQIFLGRTVGGFNSTTNHELFNLLRGSTFVTRSSVDIAHSARALFLRTPYLFVGTNDPNKEFQVWKIASNGVMTPFASISLTASVNALDCEGEQLFVALENAEGIVIIGSAL